MVANLAQAQAYSIVGCGYVGRYLLAQLLAQGADVQVFSHRLASQQTLAALGATVLAADLDQPASLPSNCFSQRRVFWLAPPPKQGEEDPRLSAQLTALAQSTGVVYISTTGVYGDCGGEWVDESWPLRPLTARAQRRCAAEQALAQLPVPVTILRVPGIYGPDRLPRKRLEQGLPVVEAATAAWSNRIHVHDLVEALLLAASALAGLQYYNVVDDEPTTMTDYFLRVAAHLGLPAPPQLTQEQAKAQLSPAMWSFQNESRRLRNDHIKQQLGWHLRHPTLASGLQNMKW